MSAAASCKQWCTEWCCRLQAMVYDSIAACGDGGALQVLPAVAETMYISWPQLCCLVRAFAGPFERANAAALLFSRLLRRVWSVLVETERPLCQVLGALGAAREFAVGDRTCSCVAEEPTERVEGVQRREHDQALQARPRQVRGARVGSQAAGILQCGAARESRSRSV